MNSNMAVIDDLRDKVRSASKAAREIINNVGRLYYEESRETFMKHDNIRVLEPKEVPFEFELSQDKHQIVIVLTGSWVMLHGSRERQMGPMDVVQVPMGSPHRTILRTETPGSKLVYVQFMTE